MSIFAELKRRNVIRVGLAYALGAWVMLQAVDFVLDLVGAPDWVIRALAALAAVGLVAAVILAWVFELTPDGLKREKDIDRAHSVPAVTGHKLDRVIIAFLVVAVLILLGDRFMQGGRAPANGPPEATVREQGALASKTAGNADASPNSIAVLPFVNMSSDPEQDYFSDGMTEEILNRLASIRELQVVARTSVFSLKGQDLDVREIARMLNVGTILEGSVRKAGDQVRITAQLIRASDGFHLWSSAYDRKLENIFSIQEEIADQIAQALQVSMGVSSMRGQSQRPVAPEVYDLYLRARALHRQRGEGLLQAISLIRQALDIDPNFAAGWAGLSHAYIVLPNYISRQERQRIGDIGAKSLAAAERALELDPDLPTALHAMGNNLLFQFKWAEAEQYYQRALALDPDSADIMEDYVGLLTYSWRFDESRRLADRMIALDPYVPIFLLARLTLAHAMGDFEMRDQDIDRALELTPDFGFIQAFNLLRLLQYGQREEARQFATTMNRNNVVQDDIQEFLDWMEEPQGEPGPGVRASLLFFPAYAMLANRFDLWLEASLSGGEEWPEWQITPTVDLVAPIVAPEQMREYRADPRSKAWLNELHLPQYWRAVGWPEACRPVGETEFECG